MREIIKQKEMCLESFNSETFEVLVSGLKDEGYVIDGREVQDIQFTSTQIEHMDQGIFNELCRRFDISPVIEVKTVGNFFSSQGAFYILYDTSVYDYQSAMNVLTKYVDALSEY